MRKRNVNPENRLKFGTEKKYQYGNLNYRIGTINKFQCKAAYISLEMWVTSYDTLDVSIEVIKRRFIKKIGSYSQMYISNLKTHYIDYVAPVEKTATIKNKPTFVSIEITLLANGQFEWNDDFIFECQYFAATAFDELLTMDNHFEMRNYK